ncbi:protein disulfide isomerase-like 5-4 [Physcomitrium patens]|uniref:Thioredoxin domain-containing protein n=1 Tax=Physcomitrium patens TaxID=3218 RepID=A0A2K1JIZ1_PHYPA|nr:hypothetical protein PHYPA_018699 [Physcomitrium patens]
MVSTSKLKSIDFYRKIPRDLTEASLSGAGLSIIAALTMVFLFGMELSAYLSTTTSTSVVVDRSRDGEYLRIDFNLSFPALSCEFASVDVSDVLGTHRFNLTKTVRKYPIDPLLQRIGQEFHAGSVPNIKSHGDEDVGEDMFEHLGEGAVELNKNTFDVYAQQFSVLVVNFYAPWCPWSNKLKASWEKAAKIIADKYNPEMDGRILLAKVDCTVNVELCRSHHIQGYPSIRIFRKGHDVRDEHGRHDHESYYGERDTESLVAFMVELVPPATVDGKFQLEDKSSITVNATIKRPAPKAGGCRVEGFVRVKKVPGELMISAHSGSHSFDATSMNMTHYVGFFSFGRKTSWRSVHWVNEMLPALDSNIDRLTGQVFPSEYENITHDHYLQVVKTEVITLHRKQDLRVLEQYDYTAHSNMIQSTKVPVVKFHYELSPMQVLVKENPKSFSHFLTNLCAIIGGVFTVAGIIDSMLHNAMHIMKKVELGKQY